MVNERTSDRASDSNGEVADEHTALLAPQRAPNPPQDLMLNKSPDALPDYHDFDEDEMNYRSEDSDVRSSGLILTQKASISSTAGLVPEAPEGVLSQQQQYRVRPAIGCNGVTSPEEGEPAQTDLDVEAAPLLGTAKVERQYLSNTNPRLFMLIFLSIMLAMFIAIFDGTIMASSHPVITSYFHSSNSASWLSTAFLLTSAALQPLTGRLSDVNRRPRAFQSYAAHPTLRMVNGMRLTWPTVQTIGRKPPYVVTMAVFAAATIWCALADSIESLIVARAFCGLGAGGMMSLGNIIISDLVPIERRGVYQSYINVVFGLAAASGAALGGLMADTLGWRWEFGVQIPPILICLAAAIVLVPSDLGIQGKRETFVEAMRSFDTAGCILLTASTTFLILAMSGLRLIVPQITGAAVGIATGLLITWSKRLKWPLVTGAALTLAGNVALCSLSRDWPSWAYLLVLVPGAAGAGFLFPGAFLAVLAASDQAEQAVVSATLVLWRALGSVLGVACSSLVLQNALVLYLGQYVSEEGHEAGWKDAVIERVRESVEAVAEFEGLVLEQVIQSYEAALRITFLCCVGVALVGFCLLLPIRLARLEARK
ncbi:hypothetical protein E8E14_007910 [Neopestalotiopsis sp. 37M]|nr:hypothetical protein E8E14_007910 [Neopestalotiopsis sp. 37M]